MDFARAQLVSTVDKLRVPRIGPEPEQRIIVWAEVPMMEATMVPAAEHYREIAGMLREAARSCQFTGARKEILHLAERLESRADHLDRRAASTTASRLG